VYFCAHELGVMEVLFERGLYFTADGVCGSCKAAEGKKEGGDEGECACHKIIFKMFLVFVSFIEASLNARDDSSGVPIFFLY